MRRGWISNVGLGALFLALCAGACGEDSAETNPGSAGAGADGTAAGGAGEEAGTAGQSQAEPGGAGGSSDTAGGAAGATSGGNETPAGGNAGAGGGAGDGGAPGGAGAGGGGEPPCDEASLRESLPDLLIAALDPAPCIAGDEELNGLVTWCENAPCSCEGSVLWTASLVGSTLTAVGNATAAVPAELENLKCTAAFTGQVVYTAEIVFSEEGGALHTTTAGGTFSHEGEAVSECSAANSLADDIAASLVATYEAIDDVAIVASNACP